MMRGRQSGQQLRRQWQTWQHIIKRSDMELPGCPKKKIKKSLPRQNKALQTLT
jgi:hypothetical protein